MSLDPKKLVDAIKMFQKKIEKQGRVTNARDEEHLERLKKLYKDMGGKKKFESVNEEKNNSENLNIEFGKVVQDFYNKANQIADKINKLKGDKTDGKIVMKNVKKQVTPLIKLMHSWNKGQQKNPNLTTERTFVGQRKTGDNYKGGYSDNRGNRTELYQAKNGTFYIWVKSGGAEGYMDLPKNIKDRGKADDIHLDLQDNFRKKKPIKLKGKTLKPESVNERMDKRQAGETLKQLGGNRFIMMTGAKNFGVGPKGMGFKIGRNSKKINYIRIDLDRGKDLYNMEFIRMARKKGELSPTMKVVKKIKGVYADQLRDLFTKYTGMYTSL